MPALPESALYTCEPSDGLKSPPSLLIFRWTRVVFRTGSHLPGAGQEIWPAAIFQFLGWACILTRRLFFVGRVNLWPIAVSSLLHPIISFEPTIFGNLSPR
jgi:hypothetical protein